MTDELNAARNHRAAVGCGQDGWPENREALASCNKLWGVLTGRLKGFPDTGNAQPAFG